MEIRVAEPVEALLQSLMQGHERDHRRHRQGMMGIGDLAELVEEDRPDLKFAPFSAPLAGAHPRIWRRLLRGDQAPRTSSSTTLDESFDVVIAFLKQAAR